MVRTVAFESDGSVRLKTRRLHTCMDCMWHRDVVTGKEADTKIEHPIYGKTTLMGAAATDVAHHDCRIHNARIELHRTVWELAKKKGLM
jgi:hypothetical protein